MRQIFTQNYQEIPLHPPKEAATLDEIGGISTFLTPSTPTEIFIIRVEYHTALIYGSYNETYPIKPYEEYLSEYNFIDQLFEFDSEYELLRPIELEIELENGSVSVYNSELRIHGTGETALEAQKDCVIMLIAVFNSYNKENVKMSQAASAFAEWLNTYLKKREH